MSWQEYWREIFGSDPVDRTSREVSVQEALAFLITGRKPAWFLSYDPTARGAEFLRAVWDNAFGDRPEEPFDWFVSEYALPVPLEWREEIGLTYGCPDFACRSGDRILVLELKTEPGSYRKRQMPDYLRLARHKHPIEALDVALLGPVATGDTPTCDDRQRYAELTWLQVPELLEQVFSDDVTAMSLARFLTNGLALPSRQAVPKAAPSHRQIPVAAAYEPSAAPAVDAAVEHALRLAPSVAQARPGDRIERGIDVVLSSDEDAQAARTAVKQALADNRFAGRVSVWLWRPASTGKPATPAGADTGREVRLAPTASKTTEGSSLSRVF